MKTAAYYVDRDLSTNTTTCYVQFFFGNQGFLKLCLALVHKSARAQAWLAYALIRPST